MVVFWNWSRVSECGPRLGLGFGMMVGFRFHYWDRGWGWVSKRSLRLDFGMRVRVEFGDWYRGQGQVLETRLGSGSGFRFWDLKPSSGFNTKVLVRYGVRVGFWVPDLLSQNPSPDPGPKTWVSTFTWSRKPDSHTETQLYPILKPDPSLKIMPPTTIVILKLDPDLNPNPKPDPVSKFDSNFGTET